jgi:hypothetical protein
MKLHMHILFSVLLFVAPLINAQEYSIENLKDENAYSEMPFSISRAIAFERGMRLFINTNDPEAVSRLIAAGKLQAQISDNEAGTERLVPVSLGKAVWCAFPGTPTYLSFADPLPICGEKQPERIEYFLEIPASLGPGLDLAIGDDPDFLWLIEER